MGPGWGLRDLFRALPFSGLGPPLVQRWGAPCFLCGAQWAPESNLIFLFCFLPCSPPTPFMPFASTLPLPPVPPGPSGPDAEDEEDYDS